MTNVFKLDDIRAEAERRFKPTTIELSDGSAVELRSLLRLGAKQREKVLATVDEINEMKDEDGEDEDFVSEVVVDVVSRIVQTVADKPKKLLADLDHEDLGIKAAMHMKVLSAWMGSTQLGEAVSSPA